MTMTDEVARQGAQLTSREHGALTISPEQTWWTEAQNAALESIGLRDTPNGDRVAFLHLCQTTGLDPFRREVYLIGRNDRTAPSGKKWTAQTGIDGFRHLAERTGVYGGKVGTQWCGPDGEWRDVWLSTEPPSAARVAVARTDLEHLVYGVAVYTEFCPMLDVWTGSGNARRKTGEQVPGDMWIKMPSHMLAKCTSGDTEVLTDHGFRRFDSVAEHERILMVTEQGLVATDARPFRQPYSGPMVTWRAGGGATIDLVMSPNHDVLLSSGEKVEAADLHARTTVRSPDSIPLTVTGSRPDADVKDDALYAAAVYLADGSDYNKTGFVVAVSRPRKVDAIRTFGGYLDERIRRSAGDTATSASGRVITTRSDKRVFVYEWTAIAGTPVRPGKQLDIDALLALSPRQARLLVDTWAWFDGDTAHPGGTRRIKVGDPHLADAFEVAAVHAGYSLSPRRLRHSDLGDVWEFTLSTKTEVHVRRRNETGARALAGLDIEPTNPSGEVWCVTVPSHVIVIRREGLSCLTGQCAEALALRTAFPRQLAGLRTSDEMQFADAKLRNAEADLAAQKAARELARAEGASRPWAKDADTVVVDENGVVISGGDVPLPSHDELWHDLTEQARVLGKTITAHTTRWVAAHKKNADEATDEELYEFVESRREQVGRHLAEHPDVAPPTPYVAPEQEGTAASTVPSNGPDEDPAVPSDGPAVPVGDLSVKPPKIPPAPKTDGHRSEFGDPVPVDIDERRTARRYYIDSTDDLSPTEEADACRRSAAIDAMLAEDVGPAHKDYDTLVESAGLWTTEAEMAETRIEVDGQENLFDPDAE
jgi:hypothetical protein